MEQCFRSEIRSTVMGDDDTVDDDHKLREGCQAAAHRADCVHEWLTPLLKESAAAKRAVRSRVG
jgi:hypothetical protein